jgi:thiamine-monophosphate kinase
MSSADNPPSGDRHPLLREDDILERIAAIVGRRTTPANEVHIGDDAAVLASVPGETLLSTDAAVWGVHLDPSLFPLEDLGFKAVATALSDLAAMGGRPRAAVVAVASPPGTDLEELHRGIADAAAMMNCPVVGGDLTRAHDVIVVVTVLGECPSRGAVLRSGARPGDELLVTGPLGRGAAGLRRRRDGAPLDDELVVAHRRPWPRIDEGVAARSSGAHAMMDLSDGLALDLHRMADASRVGFELEAIPVADGATFEEAVGGGEDYELVIATGDAARLRMIFTDRRLREPITLGRVVADPATRTFRGLELARRGWQHEF